MRPVLLVPPALEPVTLAELKPHLSVDGNEQDTLIQMYLDAAIGYLDGYSGVLSRCLMSQVWQVALTGWMPAALPFLDVTNLQVFYTDAGGDMQTLGSTQYQTFEDIDGTGIVFEGATLPLLADVPAPVQVEITSGALIATQVPAPVRGAVLLLAAHLYLNREAVVSGASPSELPFSVRTLIAPYRKYVV